MKTSTKFIGTAIIAATLIATLAGCTQTATVAAPKPTHSSSAVAAPKPTTAPAVPVGPTAATVTVGQVLTPAKTLTMKRS